MKTFVATLSQLSILSFIFIMLTSSQVRSQSFQRAYGDALDNSFSKVVQDASGKFYVLGQTEAVNGAPQRATVTRLDANGQHQWTLSLNFASIWHDAVLTPSGELMLVGQTLPSDPTSKGIMARVTAAGAFAKLRTYDEAGRDLFTKIVRQSGAFPYYVIGAQYDGGASPTHEDVVLFNMDQELNVNWKKRYYHTGDDEYFRDFEALGANTLAMAGNWADGLIFLSDNNGNISAGVQLPNRLVKDIHKELFGGVYAASTNGGNSDAYIQKFDASLFLLWEYRINGLSSISQVWEGLPGTGELYAIGVGNFGGQQRTVVVKLIETINGVTVDWVKYLTVGNGYIGGSAWFLSSVQLAFTDARTIPGGNGQTDAFISVSDLELETCEVGVTTTTLTQTDPFPNSPQPFPFVETAPITMGVNSVEASAINWQQQVACSTDPCEVTLSITPLNNCGLVQVCANATGPGPFSYQWCSGESTQCITTQIPSCSPFEFCVSVTCSDMTVATATQTYTVVDITPPVALCSGVGLDLDANCMATITPGLIDGGSSDNCQIQSMTVSPGVVSGCGLHPVTLTVTDWCGNVSTCSTSVQTIEVVPPVIVCPPSKTVACNTNTGPNTCGFATATDNCDPNPVITHVDVISGLMPCDGVIQRTWSAEDDCGNVSSCVQNIVVKDIVPPVIQCPNDLTVNTNPGQCFYTGILPQPTATDNCNPNPTVQCFLLKASGELEPITPQTNFPKGANTICCIADDGCVEVSELIYNYPCASNLIDSGSQNLVENEITGLSQAPLAALDVQSGVPGDVLVKDIFVGGACFDVSNVTTQGQANQFGSFTNGLTNIGFENGVVLATGPCTLAEGPNNSDNSGSGVGGNTPDADLSTLTTGTLFDRASLEFDFIPTQPVLSFNFVFASEEYCELVGNQFNDVLGFFISGPGIPNGQENIALIPTTSIPVNVNTVNHINYSGFYRNNQPVTSANLCGQTPSASPVVNELQFDGLTQKFTAIANVQPGQTYHLKLAIADVNNDLFDSAIFMNAGSFQAGGNASVDWVVNNNTTLNSTIENCGTVDLVFDRVGGNINSPLPVNFTVTGTAISGVDYLPITSPIVIPAGQNQFILPVTILSDGLLEADETIIVTLDNACSFLMPDVILTIKDEAILDAKCTFILNVEDKEPPTIICPPNITVTGTYNAQGICSAVVGNLTPTTSDNCPMLSLNYLISGATSGAGTGDVSGTAFFQGTSTVTYTAVDMGGNIATCSFTVTVQCVPNSIFKCGMAVFTCFSGLSNNQADPNGKVLALVDVRNHATAPLGVNWHPASSGIMHGPTWDAKTMGQVFGVTIDKNYNIYASSSTIYGKYLPPTPPVGGFGNVYKIDAATGVASTLATLPQDAANPAGLGDVWYDEVNDQLFVSNFFDGKIYRINPNNGLTIGTPYDYPGTALGTPSPGFIARGERVWAVATHNNRLYFSVWIEDRTRQEPTLKNQIWSVQLDGTGAPMPSTLQHEKDMPDLVTVNTSGSTIIYPFSSPVSDIAFSETGLMLVAERSMNNDFGDVNLSLGVQAHLSRVMELSGTSWGGEKIIHVGNPSPNHLHSAGGIDYGYESFDPTTSTLPMLCDSMIWSTGDALRFPGHNVPNVDVSPLPCGGGTGDYVYGLAGMPQRGNSNQPIPANNYVKNTSIYIDADNSLCYGEKIQIGDVDVFRNCITCPQAPNIPCDSLMVMLKEDPPGNQCCFKVDVKNNFGTSISKLQIDLCTPGIYFNTSQISVATGFIFAASNNDNTLCVTHTSGSIPPGLSSDIIRFCYGGTSGPGTFPQTLKFTWFQNVGGVDVATNCVDTTHTDCEVITDKDPCVAVTPLNVVCNPANVFEYILTFKVTNLSTTPSFNAYTVNLYGLPAGFTFSPCVGPGSNLSQITIPIPGAPLSPGQMSGNMCVKIVSSTPILSPQTICVRAKLIGIEACCTVDDKFCFTIEPCCDPCESIAITTAPAHQGESDCCYSLGVINNCPYPFFTKIEAEITTGGVTYGYNALNPALIGFWTMAPSTPMKLCVQPINGTLPGGTIPDLFSFCLDNINNPSQVPQTVVIRWITTGANGQDSVACDTTLTFNCPPVVDYKCLVIDSISIKCLPDQDKYLLTFQVTNMSAIAFCATSLDFIQLAPSDLIFSPSASYVFPTPLCQNQTQTVSICLFDTDGLPGSGNIVFIPKLSFMDGDTCCYEGVPVEIPLPSCDSCVCLGFDNLSFFEPGASNIPAWEIPVFCDSLAVELPWIANDNLYNFQGNFSCSDSCEVKVDFNLISLPSGQSVVSGTAFSYPIGFNTTHFDIPNAFNPPPGNYQLMLSGICDGDTCICDINFIVPVCDSCVCGTYSDISYRPFQGAPNIFAACNDTLIAQCNGLIPWTLGGNFLCDGNNCPPITQMYWMLMKPDGTSSSGPMSADPGFGISIPATEYDQTGCYNLTLKAICGTDTCYCDFVVKVECPDSCCTTLEAFCEKLDNNVSLSVDEALCKATINIGDIGCPYLIGSIDWGPQTVTGPFYPGDMPMFTFPGSGVYTVCYQAIELDATGNVCFEKEVCETIDLNCSNSCTCLGFQELNFINEGNFISTICNNQVPVQLACPDSTGNFIFHGDLLCSDSCATGVGWEFFDSANNSLWSGTAPVNWSSGNVFHFDLPNIPYSIFNGPGTFQLVLNGYCGADTCECIINFVVPPCDSLCPGNVVQNGMFEQGTPDGTDESIGLANDWGAIWSNSASTGDFYNTNTAPSPFGVPLPLTQGNYGAMWCRLQGTQPQWREGLMNKLGTPIGQNTGCYDLTFKLACLFNNPGPNYPGVSVFGVSTTGFGTGAIIDGSTPPNTDLFLPLATAVELGTYQIPDSCDQDFQEIVFNFNSSILPAGGITHIFFTRADGMPGVEYVAIDDVCLVEAPCPETCACGDFTDMTWRPTQGAPNQSITCGDELTLPCTPPGYMVNFGGKLDCIGNNCPPSAITWELRDIATNDLINSGPATGPGFQISIPGSDFVYPNAYKLIFTGSCDGVDCQMCMFTIFTTECPCMCGEFDKMFMRTTKGAPSIAMQCGAASVPVACPLPGQPMQVTGLLQCEGPDCPDSAPVSWKLVRLPNTTVASGNTIAAPFFGVTIMPLWYTIPGDYELQLSGFCGFDTCTCSVKFTVNCPNACPCDPLDFIADLNSDFSTTLFDTTSCLACFSPILLSDCDMVEWSVNGVSTGMTVGEAMFFYTFPTSGTYEIKMHATRFSSDGSVCHFADFTESISITCPFEFGCTSGVLTNPTFSQNAMEGILGASGTSLGWSSAGGAPMVVEGGPNTNDGWTIELSGNFDTSDVLTTLEPICLEKSTGKITLDFGIKEKGTRSALVIAFYRGDNFDINDCDGSVCFEIDQKAYPPPDRNERVQVQFPYDLSNWAVSDDCGDHSGVLVRPVVYAYNHLGFNQGGDETKTVIYIDNLCLDGQLVDLQEVSKQQSIHLYPNPTSNTLTLEFKGAVPKAGNVQILDLYGRLLEKQNLLPGHQKHQLSVADLPAGMYFVRVTDGGVPVWAEKVIKQ